MQHTDIRTNQGSQHRLEIMERVEVLLALALKRTPAAGVCPSLEEISAWYERRLTARREREVESHVARCPHCYGIWSGLLDAGTHRDGPGIQYEHTAESAAGWRRSIWRGGLIGAGLTVVCALFLVYSFLLPQRTQWPLYERVEQGYLAFIEAGLAAAIPTKWVWSSGLQFKGAEIASGASQQKIRQHQTAQQAFQYGVRVGLQRVAGADGFWRGAVQALPSKPDTCAGILEEEGCEAINRTFYELGRWAVLIHFACDVTTAFGMSPETPMLLSSDFWPQQADLMTELDASIQASLPNSRFGRFFSEWHREVEDPTQPRSVLCGREAALLSLGLQ